MGLFDLSKKKKADDGTYRNPGRDSESFRFTVQDVFYIRGRGTVVTGTVEDGSVRVGESVSLRRTDGSAMEVTVSGIEKFRQISDTAVRGENVGILLRGVEKDQVGRGDVLEKT